MNLKDHIPVVTLCIDLQGERLVVTQCVFGSTRFMGCTEAALLASPALFLDAVEDPSFQSQFIAALSEQQAFSKNIHFIPSEGCQFWLQCAFNPTGRQSGCICLMDVTDQYESIMTVKRQADFFLFMQNQLEDLFYFKDRQSRILGGNRAFCEYHGERSIESLLGTTDLDSKRIPDADKRKIYEAEQQIMEQGGVWRKREHNWDSEGEEHYFESIKTPLKGAGGKVIGLVGVTRDITEQVYSEMALEHAKQEAEMASKAKSSFLAVMSHEIRTPMNGVIGCASLLADTQLDEAQRQFVRTIKTSGDALLVLINDILDYSKIEAGKLELEHSEFELRDVVEHCLELFTKDAAEKHIEVNALVGPTVPLVMKGDSSRLRQVLSNLVSNAIKFTHTGEILVKVEQISKNTKRYMSQLRVTVRDTGVGIEQDKQDKLFQAFTQADNSVTREFGGTGLGLVICKKLVESMDGTISLISQPGEGTTVEVTLDMEYTDAKPKPEVEIMRSAMCGKTILIVDDNQTNRMVLEKNCLQMGATPKLMVDGESALKYLSYDQDVDLILLDFCMPKLHGGDFAREIKKNPHHVQTPIILLSSINAPKEYQKDVDICLLKPVRYKCLLEAMYCIVSGDKACKVPMTQETLNTKKTRILVAEDNSVNQMVLDSMLRKLGYIDVTFVGNGKLAVDAFLQTPFDLIFMDMQMPLMDGLEATKRIRNSKEGRFTWVVALTAAALKEDEERAFSAGVNAYVSKPITLESLNVILVNAEKTIRNRKLAH